MSFYIPCIAFVDCLNAFNVSCTVHISLCYMNKLTYFYLLIYLFIFEWISSQQPHLHNLWIGVGGEIMSCVVSPTNSQNLLTMKVIFLTFQPRSFSCLTLTMKVADQKTYAAHWNSCVTLLVVWRGGPGNFFSCWSMASSRLLINKAGKHGLNSDGICLRWFLRGLLMRWKLLAKLKIWWSAELFFITSLIANDWNLVH